MKDKSVETNSLNSIKQNYFDENKLFQDNFNITGISFEKLIIKKNNYKNTKNNNLNLSCPIKEKNKNTESSFYNSLPKIEKIKYIHKLIKNSSYNEPYDNLAVKRKRYSTSYLIKQFDTIEKPKSFEENKICKIPYPLLYCISNRKLENNSSNLLSKILSSKDKKLSKEQENEIKYSLYSKIFNTDISELIKKKNYRSKSNINKNTDIINNNISIVRNNLINMSSNKKLPLLNKFIKSKVKIYNHNNKNKNENFNKHKTSVGFFLPKWKKLNFRKYIKRIKSNSTSSLWINGKMNYFDKDKSDKNIKIKNIVETFRNRTVCLVNYKNNMKNNNILNERFNKILEDNFTRNKNNKIDPKFNKIIEDISHLKSNNQIMPFNAKINEL